MADQNNQPTSTIQGVEPESNSVVKGGFISTATGLPEPVIPTSAQWGTATPSPSPSPSASPSPSPAPEED
jgi:hypothetical protein